MKSIKSVFALFAVIAVFAFSAFAAFSPPGAETQTAVHIQCDDSENEISLEPQVQYEQAFFRQSDEFRGFDVTVQYAPPIERFIRIEPDNYTGLDRQKPELPPSRHVQVKV